MSDFYKVVMNEAALKAFGYTKREEAFIKGENPLWRFEAMDGTVINGGMSLMPVEAIVKDYYAGHLTAGKSPLYIWYQRDSGFSISDSLCTRKRKAVD